MDDELLFDIFDAVASDHCAWKHLENSVGIPSWKRCVRDYAVSEATCAGEGMPVCAVCAFGQDDRLFAVAVMFCHPVAVICVVFIGDSVCLSKNIPWLSLIHI